MILRQEMDPPSPRQSVRAPGGAQYGDATTEARMDGSAMSYLEQPWEATEGKGGELVDIREFRRKWQAVLRPPSPRVDHLDYILLQHQYPRQRSLPPSADIALRVLGDEDTENLVPPPDLSCDDIFIGTARQQIQAAIEREMVHPFYIFFYHEKWRSRHGAGKRREPRAAGERA